MTNFQVRADTLLEGFETVGDWTAAGGTVADETTLINSGSHSLKVTSGAGTYGAATKTINVTLTGSRVGYWVYVPSLTEIASVWVYISSTADFSKYFSVSTLGTKLHLGWNYLQYNLNDFTNTSGDSWASPMISLRMRVNATTDNTAVVYYDSFYYGGYNRPKVVFTFDDGIGSIQEQALPYMAKYGWVGTEYINYSTLGTPGSYATVAQIQSLYDGGWDIGNHTYSHIHMNSSDAATIQTELDTNKAALVANGWTRRDCHLHFCYPYGEYNQTNRDQVAASGYITATTTTESQQPNYLDDPMLLNRRELANTVSLVTAKGYVDTAISRGSTIIFYGHKLVASASTTTEWDIANFQALCDYIKSKEAQIDVVPMTQWYEQINHPRKIA